MLKKIADIVSVSGNKVKIKFTRNKMCSCCSFSYLCGEGKETLYVDSRGLTLQKGDRVEVAIDDTKVLLANFIIFLLPCIILISGLIIFKKQGEALSFFLALLAIYIYYIAVKAVIKTRDKKFSLNILRKLPE